DRVHVVDQSLLRRRAVAEAQRDGGVARPLAADAQGARLGELLEGRVVLAGRYAEADLAVEEHAAVAELTVRPLLPPRPDLAERDPQAAVHDGRSFDEPGGASVLQPGSLGQVLPGSASLVRVVGRRFG